MFIDRSIIEVIVNERQCRTIRVYPAREDSSQVSVFARGSEAKLVSMHTWQIRSIWEELKAQEGDRGVKPHYHDILKLMNPSKTTTEYL